MKFAIAMVAVSGLGICGFSFPMRAAGTTMPGQRVQAAAPAPAAPAPLSRSVWDGIYTIGQARRGSAHAERCEPCHGSDLEGDFGPALMGPAFTATWDGRTVGDLFELIQINFAGTYGVKPVEAPPESLSRQNSADFLAYLLIQNQFPVGKTELPIDVDVLKQIRFQASRPPREPPRR